jgi:hypothetical protein
MNSRRLILYSRAEVLTLHGKAVLRIRMLVSETRVGPLHRVAIAKGVPSLDKASSNSIAPAFNGTPAVSSGSRRADIAVK